MKILLAGVLGVAALGCKAKEQPPAGHVWSETASRTEPIAADDAARTGSGLAEDGPHPEYPTPVGAGTDKIFLLEDPDRGPKPPRTFAVPAVAGATTHAHCEHDNAFFVCGPAPANGTLERWRVARSKTVTVAVHAFGGRTERTYVVLSRPDGTPTRRIELDGRGRVTGAMVFSKDGRRYTSRRRDGSNALSGCGSMTYQLDEDGRVSERSCLQWTGEPMRDTDGAAKTRFVRDANGFAIDHAYFGIDDKPLANNDGVHRIVYERDPAGRVVMASYRDVDGNPVASITGCHGYRYEREARGLVARMICLRGDGTPGTSIDGHAIEQYTSDARGCRVRERGLTTGDQPAADHDGVHGRDYEVDARCQPASETCLGSDGEPKACAPDAPARKVFARNAAGNIVSTKHYAADGKPGFDASYGVFELRSRWDDFDHALGESCHDSAGKLIDCGSTGLASSVRTFDEAGRLTEERFLDPSNQPTTNLGVAVRRFRYDNYDHEYESTGYDAGGEPVDSFGSTTRRDLYDAAHRHFGVLLFDKQGKPARYTGCYVGSTCPTRPWHAVRIVRRADGMVESNMFFDAAGQLLETTDCRTVRCFD